MATKNQSPQKDKAVESHFSDVNFRKSLKKKVNGHSLVLIPKTEHSWSGNQTRHSKEVVVKLKFAVQMNVRKQQK